MYLNVNANDMSNMQHEACDHRHCHDVHPSGGGIREDDHLKDLDGDGDGDAACTTPEIITSICNAYITLAASSSSSAPGLQTSMADSDGHGDCEQLNNSANHQIMMATAAAFCDGHNQRHQQRMSPCPSTPSPSMPPSIEATRTHLIKESLKVTIQCKRRLASSSSSISSGAMNAASMTSAMDDYNNSFIKDELTPEDEERRRRRRERNKVAATKCRNKKKERTVTLLMESDSLEQTNSSLRTEIQKLEVEKQRLLEMLNYHIPGCPLQTVQMVGSDNGGLGGGGFDGFAQRPQLQVIEGTRCGQVHEAVESRGAWAGWGSFRNSMPHRTV